MGGEKSPDDKVMLVPIIKFSETPEGVFLITSSHLIGLKRFDEFECGRGDSLSFTFEIQHVFLGQNWPRILPGRYVILRSDQFEDQMIDRCL